MLLGYPNSQEQQKAAKVRKLVNDFNRIRNVIIEHKHKNLDVSEMREQLKCKQKQANDLSLELVNYLKINYVNNFVIISIDMANEDKKYFTNNEKSTEDQKQLRKLFRQYNKQLKYGNILIFKCKIESFYPVLFNNGEGYLFGIKTNQGILIECDFYDILEELGLTMAAVNELYGFTIVNHKHKAWPNFVKLSEKLM